MAAPNSSKPDVGDILMVIRELLPYPTILGPIASILLRNCCAVQQPDPTLSPPCSWLIVDMTMADFTRFADDFQARSSDELSLAKGDRVELLERDDEFGDGWYLGKHMVNGNSGLFPEGRFAARCDPTSRLTRHSVYAASAQKCRKRLGLLTTEAAPHAPSRGCQRAADRRSQSAS